MILRVALVAGLTIALVLFILSLSISGWPCGGLFEQCQDPSLVTPSLIYDYHVVGGLLVVAALASFVSLVLAMCALRRKRFRNLLVSAVWCFVAFTMSFTAEIYFHTKSYNDWSAFIATIAMVLSFSCCVIKVARMCTLKSSPVNVFTPMEP
ncbi:unnamed protein product [Mesocestoides corti]|uniref:MARVEL domain-containing protein n=1 Tax=Mesocestoides corti TaxID=53468 RepID=A0A0R3UE25_MESCO|nr:unnamed protein product [Mesocestoides corti]